MTNTPATPARTVAGRYRIERLLARGGMAAVYLAEDELLARPVALKVLSEQRVTDPSYVARFEREARSGAALAHPNIVAIYDTGVDDELHFIAMEYVEGVTLAREIAERAPLPVDEACRIGAEIADALDHAHRHGMIHRDVKPSNVLLTTDGVTKVTDFGIARAVSGDETLTEVGMVMGTPTYSSPEQAQGSSLDPRSDLYSLGVVLFEMVTGARPFAGPSPFTIAQQHVEAAPPLASSKRPELAGALDTVIDTLLAKDPDSRYRTGAELAAELRRVARGGDPARAPMAAAPLDGVSPPGGAVSGKRTIEPDAATAAMAPAAPGIGAAGATGRTAAMPSWMQPDGGEPPESAGWPADDGHAGRAQRSWSSRAFAVLAGLVAVAVVGLGAIVAVNALDGSGDDDETDAPTTAPVAEADEPAPELPEAGPASVPAVVDELEANARQTLVDSGFAVEVSYVDVDPGDGSVGRVIGQNPAGGEDATAGSTISLQVARATAATTEAPTTAPSTTTTAQVTTTAPSTTTTAQATTTESTAPQSTEGG